MRIAILGAGSLGTIAGAYIAAAGQDVELIDVNQAHVHALNQSGAQVVGTLQFTAPVHAITPDQMSGKYDLVLLLTKQLYNDAVLQHLLPYIGEQSVVCSLQNGIPEEKVASIVGRKRVIAGSVEYGATWMEPGVSSLTTEAEMFKKYAFQIGELDGVTTKRIERIQAILDLVGGTHISDNLVGTKWSKLLINNAFSGMSAALGGTYGDVLDDAIGIRSAVHIADETIKVGHAYGVNFAKMNGFDVASLEVNSNADIKAHIHTLRVILQPTRLLKASMLQDLEKKRQTEIDFINGVIPQLAKERGLVAPYNELVVELVKQAESAQSVPRFNENIARFEKLYDQVLV
ncbi:ketopantoate reductase family protein [Sulfoacidibacillus ferrooxidans]|uniref:2-dehydropantoate 2-reductase n=1 Tax=Sulfoacidibacillus ferrooxidans TaxID=2005001 RepID=A0A9X1V964_9BACL|nr:ketopantoate reductase family protein [Sulfoacidibacillus ferrooxidans]MCI0182413.1 putative 2-dehydropantoate 2-reductase [Sulfoacidibacillus ferrooxidans]